MNNISLTVEDFQDGQRSLNFSGFTNLEKGVSELDFNLNFIKNPNFVVIEGAKMNELVKSLKSNIESKENDIEKAETITHSKSFLSNFKKIKVKGKDGLFWVANKKDVQTEETIEKSGDGDLEKGIVADNFKYDNKIEIVKTGKEIKEKLEVILANYATEQLSIVSKMSVLVGEIGFSPTRTVDSWKLKENNMKDTFIHKIYEYNCCYFSNASHHTVVNFEGSEGASSKEEADNCREYNDLVEKLCDIVSDVHFSTTLKNNLDDNSKIKLQPKQLTSLGF